MTHFRELGQKYKNIFIQFLVQVKTLNFAFEINWQLIYASSTNKEAHIRDQHTSFTCLLELSGMGSEVLSYEATILEL